MPLELSDVKFLDVIEQKARNGVLLTQPEYVRLDGMSLNTGAFRIPGDLGVQARVNIARQKIIDKVTATLVNQRPRFIHRFHCASCSSVWTADSNGLHMIMKCPSCAMPQESADFRDWLQD